MKISSLSPWVGIRNISDYSSFGVLLAERTVEGVDFRYGVQGYEGDSEVKGEGNSYTTEFRHYDPRTSRWLSVDPLAHQAAGWSPYRFCFENPIMYIDPDGRFETRKEARQYKKEHGIEGIIRKDPDGEFNISNKYKGISYSKGDDSGLYGDVHKNDGVVESSFVLAERKNGFLNSLDKVNNYIGNISQILQEGSIVYISSQFKSNNNNFTFSQLKDNQQAWRTKAVVGAKATSALKVVKVAGGVATIATPIIHGIEMYDKANDNDPNTNNSTMEKVDLGVESAGAGVAVASWLGWFGTLSNPIGWGAGVVVVGYSAFRYGQEHPEAFNESFRAEPGLNACFVSGTLILMDDGTQKEIEKVQLGDSVLSYNFQTKQIEAKKVTELASPIHTKLVEITFAGTNKNLNTFDHPYFVKGKGWSSYDPAMTFKKYNLKVEKIETGDVCYDYNNGILAEIQIVSLIEVTDKYQTYNLNNVEDNNNFFANGVLVHNKVTPPLIRNRFFKFLNYKRIKMPKIK